MSELNVVGIKILPNGKPGWLTHNGIFSCECIAGPYAKAIEKFIYDKDAEIIHLQENIARLEAHTESLAKLNVLSLQKCADANAECERLRIDAARYRKGAHGNFKSEKGELGMCWVKFVHENGALNLATVLWVTDKEVDDAMLS